MKGEKGNNGTKGMDGDMGESVSESIPCTRLNLTRELDVHVLVNHPVFRRTVPRFGTFSPLSRFRLPLSRFCRFSGRLASNSLARVQLA